jgi:predicted PurR-regulated permease PerM
VLAFGFIGLFLGPTFLALGQALFSAWTAITRCRRGRLHPA